MNNHDTDDLELFRQALKGVRPITHDRADTGKPRVDRVSMRVQRQRAVHAQQPVKVDGLSDQYVIDVLPEQELAWTANGVQDSQLRKLKAGQIFFDGSIDLHGQIGRAHV